MANIIEEIGDIFSAPTGSILIHACNAKGSWGAGVALAFKNKYPQAFKTYTNYCKQCPPIVSLPAHQKSIVGTTLLIPPQESRSSSFPQHWIACLFTSHNYGRNVDSATKILQNTELALSDLARQLIDLQQTPKTEPDSTNTIDTAKSQKENNISSTAESQPGSLYAVRINSGKFGVPWLRTKEILQRGPLDITVFRPEGEDETGNKPAEIPTAVRRKREREQQEPVEPTSKRQTQPERNPQNGGQSTEKAKAKAQDNHKQGSLNKWIQGS